MLKRWSCLQSSCISYHFNDYVDVGTCRYLIVL